MLPNKMATERADSVIARLMGLDELPPQQPSSKQRRVLSENYIHKVVSICRREGSSIRRKYNTNRGMLHGANTIFGVQLSKNEQAVSLDKCANSRTSEIDMGVRSEDPADASVPNSLSGASYENRNSMGKEVEDCARRKNILRYLQKLDNDSYAGRFSELGADYTKKFSKFHFDVLDKPGRFTSGINVFKPKLEKVRSDFGDEKLDIHSRLGCRKHKETVVNNISVLRRGCIFCDRTRNRISRQWKSKDVSSSRCEDGNYSRTEIEACTPPFLPDEYEDKNHNHAPGIFVNQSSLDNEAEGQDFERQKTANEVKETVALANEPVPRNLNLIFDRNSWKLKQDKSSGKDEQLKKEKISRKDFVESRVEIKQDKSSGKDKQLKKEKISGKDFVEPRVGRSCEKSLSSPCVSGTMSENSKFFESSDSCLSCFDSETNPESSVQRLQDEINNSYENDAGREMDLSPKVSKTSISDIAFQCTIDDKMANAENLCCGVCSEVRDDLSESNPSNLFREDGHTSSVPKVFNGQVLSNEFSVAEAYPNCSWIGPPEFRDDSNGINQRSPDSVLEPFDNQHPTLKSSESLQLLLQALNSASEVTYSEGSIVVVSGDEDSEDESGCLSVDGRKVERWFKSDESRNFSYLVDVLDEAGFCGVKSFTDFKKWDSLEFPISPLVFESLEKKYGKQTSWQKSERRLLFDRINSGLLRILSPLRNFHPSLRKRFNAAWRREEVEDELWIMLISEEKEKNRELSEKVMSEGMKWLELEEDVNIICGELVTSLFDELVFEFATLWD